MFSGDADDNAVGLLLTVLKWLGVALIGLASIMWRQYNERLHAVEEAQKDTITRQDLKDFEERITRLIELEFKARFGA